MRVPDAHTTGSDAQDMGAPKKSEALDKISRLLEISILDKNAASEDEARLFAVSMHASHAQSTDILYKNYIHIYIMHAGTYTPTYKRLLR